MKRVFVSLISTILAFTAGLVTASSWNSDNRMGEPVVVNASPPCLPALPEPPAPVLSYSATPPAEFDFGQNGLRLVPERVKLDSNILGYDIDVSYPQILDIGQTETTNIRRVNQQLKEAATKLYEWPMSREGQSSYVQGKGIRNTVNFTYQVGLATDSFLAVHFIGYSFNSHSTQRQESFTVNYDLTSGKALKLSDIFKPHSNYLQFISQDCIDAMRSRNLTPILEGLEPTAENFKVWQITTSGITFNFHSCLVANCSEGDLSMEISFEELKPILNPDIPGKFKITYP